MYERILVPTDGSTGTRRAIDHAVDLAATDGATIHALYVVNAASFASLPMETSWEGVADMLEEEGEEAVGQVERRAAERDVPVVTAVIEGTPSREIVNYAVDEDCDLIVMGTHGRGGLDRLLLGSVAERVVRSSAIPVLTLRMHEETAEA